MVDKKIIVNNKSDKKRSSSYTESSDSNKSLLSITGKTIKNILEKLFK